MQPKIYPYETRTEEAKIMRALVAAGNAGFPYWKIIQMLGPGWKQERALKRLLAFDKARCETIKTKTGRKRIWFALIADDTMEHGLDPEWAIEIAGA